MTKQKIAVAGATGRAGRHAVEALEAAGHDAVRISRGNGVDIITGKGLAEALEGVEVIIDAATGPSPEQDAATEFFTTAAAMDMGMGINAQLDAPSRFQAKGLGSGGAPGCPAATWCVQNAHLCPPSEAVEAGFLDEVVPLDQVEARAVEIAKQLAESVHAVPFQITRSTIQAALVENLRASLEADLKLFDLSENA